MNTKLSDSDLIKQYCDGNDEMIGLLFLRYHSLFMATSKKYFCNTECAEDVIQDLLLKFLSYSVEKRVVIFSKIRNVRAFIYTAVRNMAYDAHRKKKVFIVELLGIDFPDDESEVYNNLIIDYSVVGLSKNESLYFNDYINEKSLDTISKEHGVSKSTIKNTIQNAKKKIIHHYRNNHLES